jgi:alpha-beta hydrolase superfamily lysophospholipase
VSGLCWGLSYGVVWWVLGPLTLLPVLTGGPSAWSAAGLAAAFPALVGHLAYGAVLGLVVERLQDRADPWWFSRSQAEARTVAEEREQVQGSAPALWGLMLFVALTVPVLVAG